jgi:hypothetical protein
MPGALLAMLAASGPDGGHAKQDRRPARGRSAGRQARKNRKRNPR